MMPAFFTRFVTRERKGPPGRYKVSHREVGWPAKDAFIESDAALLEFLRRAEPQKITCPGPPDGLGNSTTQTYPVTLEAVYREILALSEEKPELVRLEFFEANFREASLALASKGS